MAAAKEEASSMATTSYFDDAERRGAMILELRSWLKTPFVLRAAVKGQGVDCVYLCGEMMRACGVIESFRFPAYSLDWAKHHDNSLVLAWLDACPRFTRLPEGEPPQAGDIACFQFGRCVHHCGVMLDGLRMIHALEKREAVESQLDDSTWAKRLVCFYRPLPHENET
jgi:cell wall-associated NlpC family hydrolase